MAISLGGVLSSVKAFYIKKLSKELRQFKRHKLFGVVLLLIRQLFYLLLLSNDSIKSSLINVDQNFSGIMTINLNTLDSSLEWIVYLSSFTLVFILTVLWLPFLETQCGISLSTLRTILSFFFQSYDYIIFIPLVSLNLALESVNQLAIINVVSAILISYAVKYQDKDFGYNQTDFLRRRNSMFWDVTLLILEFLAAFVSSVVSYDTLNLVINSCLGVWRLISCVFNRTYSNRLAHFFELFLSILHTLISFSIATAIIFDARFCLTLLLFCFLPISLKIALEFEANLKNNFSNFFIQDNLKAHSQLEPQEFDERMRQLWQYIKTPFEDYKKNATLSIVFENLFTSHSVICKNDLDKCSICQNMLTQETEASCLDGLLREKYLKGYIISSYKSYFKEQSQSKQAHVNTQMILGYISFLVEIEQSKVMSYIELIRLKQHVKFSLQEQSYLDNLFTSAKVFFDVLPRPESNPLENELLKKDQKNDSELQNLLLGIYFDESINETEEKYFQVLKQKQKYLLLLSTDFIDLQSIKKSAISLLKEKDTLKQRLAYLASINISSSKLQFYMDNYISYLGFGENKKRLFFKKQQNKSSWETQNYTTVRLPAFDKQSCIIFVSLSDKVGTIKRIQNKFENLFGFPLKQSVGKNISIILPPLVAKYHDLALMNYVEKGSSVGKWISQQNKDTSSQVGDSQKQQIYSSSTFFPMMIAKDNNNWAIPVSMHFRTECIQLTDCGVAGLIKIINSEYLYIMTNCKYFKIESVSKVFFEKILSKYISKDQINMVYLNRMIPILHYFEKQWVNSTTGNDKSQGFHKDLVKTVAFLPKQENFQAGNLIQSVLFNQMASPLFFEKLTYQSLQKEIQRFSIEHYDMYSIKMKFHHQKSTFEPFNVIEIQSIKKITSPQTQQENLFIIKSQLKTLLNVDFDITYDLKILKKVEQLTQIHLNSSEVASIENSSEEGKQSIQNNHSSGGATQRANQFNLLAADSSQKINIPKNIHGQMSINQVKHRSDDKQFDLEIGGGSMQIIEIASADKKAMTLDSSRINLMKQQHQQYQYESLDLSSTRLIPNPILRLDDYQGSNVLKSSSLLTNQDGFVKNNNKIQIVSTDSVLDSPQTEQQDGLVTQRVDINNTYLTTSNLNTDIGMLPIVLVQQVPTQEKSQLKTKGEVNSPANQKTSLDKEKQPHSIFWILKEKLHQIKLKKLAKKLTNNKDNITQSDSKLNTQKNILSTLVSSSPNYNTYDQQHLETFLRSYQEMICSDNDIFQKKRPSVKQINEHKLRVKNVLDEDDNNPAMVYEADSLGGLSSQEISNSMALEQERQIMQLSRMSSSVQTSQTNNYEQKHKVRGLLVDRRKDNSLITLNFFGLISIIAITVLTIIEYAQINSLFDEAKSHITNIPWANTMRAMFVFPIAYVAFNVMLEQNVFGDPSLYDSNYGTSLSNWTESNLLTFKNLIKEYYQEDIQNKNYFQYINSIDVPFQVSLDDKSVPLAQQFVNIPSNKFILPVKLQYFINFIYEISYLNIRNKGYDPWPEKIILDNFSTVSSNLTYVQNQVILKSQDVLSSIEANSQFQLGLVLGVSFTLIFMLFPLYYFVQYKNQEVLKLLGTLTPNSLTSMTKQVQLGLFLFSNISRSIKSEKSLKINTEPLRKKKNISQTTEIPKFHFSLLFLGLLAFTMVIIQPIITTIIIHQYNSEAQINTTLLGTLYDLIAQSSSNHAIAYKYMKSQLLINDSTYNPLYYLARSKVLGGTNSAVLTKVSKIVESSQNQSKRQQSLYDNFLYPMLNTNICQALSDYPEYISSTNSVDLSTCSTISSGILTQGFQIAMKKYYQFYAQLYEIFSLGTNVSSQLLAWQQKNNIREFEALSEFLIHTTIVQKDFLLIIMSDDIDYIHNIQLILVILQVTQLLLVFSFGWYKFYEYVSSEMFIIRKSLTLLSIDAVLENPYMVSYLTN